MGCDTSFLISLLQTYLTDNISIGVNLILASGYRLIKDGRKEETYS
mgnify:CR=1 FL=1